MARFLECTELVTGKGVSIGINFDNVQTLETVEQSGRTGSKVTFVGGRYVLLEQSPKTLSDLVNATPA
jgi:hypothetical protein